jgi:hypothetical protein
MKIGEEELIMDNKFMDEDFRCTICNERFTKIDYEEKEIEEDVLGELVHSKCYQGLVDKQNIKTIKTLKEY